MIILQIFVFDKTYHLVLRDSALVYPEIWDYKAKGLWKIQSEWLSPVQYIPLE